MKKNLLKVTTLLAGLAVPLTASVSYAVATQGSSNATDSIAATTTTNSNSNTTTSAEQTVDKSQVRSELVKLLSTVTLKLKRDELTTEIKPSLLTKTDLTAKYSYAGLELLNKKNVKVKYNVLSNSAYKNTLATKNTIKYVNDMADKGIAVVAVTATYHDGTDYQTELVFKYLSGFKTEDNKTELINVDPVYVKEEAPKEIVKETEIYKVVLTDSLEVLNQRLQDNAQPSGARNSRLPIQFMQRYAKLNATNEADGVEGEAFGFARYGQDQDNKIIVIKKEYFDTIDLVSNKNVVDESNPKNNRYISAEYNMETGILTLHVLKKDKTTEDVEINLN
ncbi:hypothetical protein [Mycoplasmopsis columboralis]|uniref:Uncharacterized protein n=1 Tax=Mycoplasmopsis columboralis TaxID=171282 RepID=A0A449B5W6_9BACT|nr:hypothetical protein [Mycoplasmopsis columboralis]VEU76000.1 Uncharacterised protein [Mycoplasmopsis columboralis]